MRLVPTLNYRPLVVGTSQERMDDNVSAYFKGLPLSRKFCAVYMRWLYFPFFDHHIANSDYTAAELREAGRGQLVPRGTWIRKMGVDLEHFSPQRRRPELRRRLLQNFGADEKSTLLLYVGRLVPEKNLPLLFDLIANLARDPRRDYRLLVVGDGIDRELCERRTSQESPGRVVFLGHISDNNVLADLYANSDVFVHPNPREPFGIAPLEAMASGLPLVAPNSGGILSYANPDNAWTVSPDVETFTAAIEEVMNNRPLVADKTEKALATANLHRWETVAQSFLELYEQLHRLHADSDQLPTAAFSSTPAKGPQAAMMRAVASMAKGTFQLWARAVSTPDSRRPPMTPNPIRRS